MNSSLVVMKVPIVRNETPGPLMINLNDGGYFFIRAEEEKIAPGNIIWLLRQKGFILALLTDKASIVGSISESVDPAKLWPEPKDSNESEETAEPEWEE